MLGTFASPAADLQWAEKFTDSVTPFVSDSFARAEHSGLLLVESNHGKSERGRISDHRHDDDRPPVYRDG